MCHFWATLNTRKPWIYTEIHMGSCHSISHTWKPRCTLNHFYFSSTALKRKYFANWEFSVSWLPLYQRRNMKKPQFTTSCRNVCQISIAAASMTEWQLNLSSCQRLFKLLQFLLQHSLTQSSWDNSTQHCFLTSGPSPHSPMLFIAVNSPNLMHQHWEGQKTAKCPNKFDWDCSFTD